MLVDNGAGTMFWIRFCLCALYPSYNATRVADLSLFDWGSPLNSFSAQSSHSWGLVLFEIEPCSTLFVKEIWYDISVGWSKIVYVKQNEFILFFNVAAHLMVLIFFFFFTPCLFRVQLFYQNRHRNKIGSLHFYKS